MTLNGGPAGRAGWRAVFPIRKHEFAAGWRAARKGGLDIRAGGLNISVERTTLIGGPAGRAGWRAMFPNEKREFSVGWRCQVKFLTCCCFSVIFLLRIKKYRLVIRFLMCVCCVNWNILVRCQVPATRYSTGISSTIENFRAKSFTSIIFIFLTLTHTLTRHTYLNTYSWALIISFINVIGM